MAYWVACSVWPNIRALSCYKNAWGGLGGREPGEFRAGSRHGGPGPLPGDGRAQIGGRIIVGAVV
jgi:hypothetical protein